jgi:hypothetical protein
MGKHCVGASRDGETLCCADSRTRSCVAGLQLSECQWGYAQDNGADRAAGQGGV